MKGRGVTPSLRNEFSSLSELLPPPALAVERARDRTPRTIHSAETKKVGTSKKLTPTEYFNRLPSFGPLPLSYPYQVR